MIRVCLSVLTCSIALGCSSPLQVGASRPRAAVAVPSERQTVASDTTEAVDLAEVEPGTHGPLVVPLVGGNLAVWAAPGELARTLHAAAMDSRGNVKGEALAVGQVVGALGLLQLRAIEESRTALLVYSAMTETRATKVFALLLDEQGHHKAPPVELVTTEAPLLWMDVVDSALGAVVYFATGQDNRAEVRAVGMTAKGAVRFADREVASSVRAWQVAASPSGAVLGIVRGDASGRGSRVEILLLDAQAAPIREAIPLASQGQAEPALDLVRVGNSYLLAWSERRRVDSRILLAAVDATGTVVSEPAFATPALGEQALVKLVAAGPLGRAALLWEELNLPTDRRRVSMVEIDEQAKRVSDVAALPCSAQSSQLPEVVATANGWSILTLDDGTARPGDDATEPTPIYIELGAQLALKAATRLEFASELGPPLLAWGLDCNQGCRATVAFDGPRVRLKTALLPRAEALGIEPTAATTRTAASGTTKPRLVELETLVELEPLADFAVTEEGDGFQLSYLTYFDRKTPLVPLGSPGPDGRKEPLQARVALLGLSSSLQSGATATVSYRATSQPGVAMALGDNGERILAWSALDQDSPQLFVSKMAADGRKVGQRMLTHRKGGLDDVTIVPSGDGFLAAWIDDRTGTAALHAIRLTKTLERRGNEQRVSLGQGSVTAIALLPRDGYVLSVWVEARTEGRERRLALFSRRLSLLDASPLSTPQRLLDLGGAVRFLGATRYESGAVLSWLEVMQGGSSVDEPGRIRFLRLDAQGQVAGSTTGLSDTELAPVSLAVDCPNRLCRGVVNLDLGGRGQLSAFVFDPAEAKVPELYPLVRSLGTVEQNVPPILIGSHLFAVDQVDAERVRLQHATIEWE